jgi:hypothetical protein
MSAANAPHGMAENAARNYRWLGHRSLIYFIERHPAYLPLLLPFFEAVERGDIQVVTSTLTLTEVLVHPYRTETLTWRSVIFICRCVRAI